MGRPQDVILGRPQDVIFGRPQDVGRERPQEVDMGHLLALHIGPYGDVHRTSFGTSSGRPRDVILPSGQNLPELISNI